MASKTTKAVDDESLEPVFVRICADRGHLFALDDNGWVHHWNVQHGGWERLQGVVIKERKRKTL